MAATRSSGATIKTKARELLAFAKKQAKLSGCAGELYITIFGSQGKASFLFSTKREWAALFQTAELEEIRKLIENFPRPVVTLNLPKSVHAALLAEAAAEQVSLDQLCLSKLVAQLRDVV